MISSDEHSEEYCEFFEEGGWCNKDDEESCTYHLETEDGEGVCELDL